MILSQNTHMIVGTALTRLGINCDIERDLDAVIESLTLGSDVERRACKSLVLGKDVAEWKEDERDCLRLLADKLEMWAGTVLPTDDDEDAISPGNILHAEDLPSPGQYNSDLDLDGDDSDGGSGSDDAAKANLVFSPIPVATSKQQKKATKKRKTRSANQTHASFHDKPVSGKRNIAQPRRFGSTPQKTSALQCGEGFECPFPSCSNLLAYDLTKCAVCSNQVQYQPGLGAILIKSRDTARQSRAKTAAVPTKSAATLSKKNSAKRTKKKVVEIEEEAEEDDETGEDEEGEDDDSSSSSSSSSSSASSLDSIALVPLKFEPLPVSEEICSVDDESNDESVDDSYEEKMYKKSIRDRRRYAEYERKEAEEHKDAMEHEEANDLFFRRNRQQSPRKLRREEDMLRFVQHNIVVVKSAKEYSRLEDKQGLRDCCENPEFCKLCNNYYGSEVTNFDAKVEDPERMPRCFKIETGVPSARRRRIDREFAMAYNKGWLDGEALG